MCGRSDGLVLQLTIADHGAQLEVISASLDGEIQALSLANYQRPRLEADDRCCDLTSERENGQ